MNLMRDDNKHPDGTTLLPWARGKPMAWDVTVPDTYAESHIGSSPKENTEENKQIYVYGQHTHLLPICHRNIETAGTWHEMAIELNIPFPMPFHGSTKRKCGFFPQHHGIRLNRRCNHNFVCLA